MGVLWGFVIYFVTHTFVNMFILNVYSYSLEKKQEKPIQNALNRFLGKAVIAFIIFIPIFVVFLAVEYFYDFRPAILIGSGIGMITASIHFKLIIKDYYQKSRAQADWDSWNHMSFEEKYDRIKKIQDALSTMEDSAEEVEEDTEAEVPTKLDDNEATMIKQTTSEREHVSSTSNDSFCEELDEETIKEIESIFDNEPPIDQETIIVNYIKEKGFICSEGKTFSGDRFVSFHYGKRYLWDITIRIDKKNKIIALSCPYFDFPSEKSEAIVELLNDFNLHNRYAKLYYENPLSWDHMEDVVMAVYDFPLVSRDIIGEVVFKISMLFCETLDKNYKETHSAFLNVLRSES